MKSFFYILPLIVLLSSCSHYSDEDEAEIKKAVLQSDVAYSPIFLAGLKVSDEGNYACISHGETRIDVLFGSTVAYLKKENEKWVVKNFYVKDCTQSQLDGMEKLINDMKAFNRSMDRRRYRHN